MIKCNFWVKRRTLWIQLDKIQGQASMWVRYRARQSSGNNSLEVDHVEAESRVLWVIRVKKNQKRVIMVSMKKKSYHRSHQHHRL